MNAVDFESFVFRLADVSGETILPFFRSALGTQDKGRPGAFDPVTEADRAAETAMRRLIEAQFPSHGVIGEEFGSVRTDAPYVWALDPIDGTKSFISGLPVWGTLIGLLHHAQPCYGMMNQPFIGERFFGDGASAHWTGPGVREKNERRRLRTRACAGLAEATIMTTSPSLISPEKREFYHRVEHQARLHRYGGDCYAYCALAAGHVDAVIEDNLQPYDILALIPIILGAGGVITTWDGEDPSQGGAIIAAGDAKVHAAALDILSKAPKE